MDKLAPSTEQFRRLSENDKDFTQRESPGTELQSKTDVLPQRLALQVDDFFLKEHPESRISPPMEAVCSVSAVTSHHLALSLTTAGPLVNNIQPKSPSSLSAVQADAAILMGSADQPPASPPPKTSSLSLDAPPLSDASIDPKGVAEVQLEAVLPTGSDPRDRTKPTIEDAKEAEGLAVVPVAAGAKEAVVASLLTPASLDDVDEEDRPLTVDLSTTVEPTTDDESPQKKPQSDIVDSHTPLAQSPAPAKPAAPSSTSPNAGSTTSPRATTADIVPVSARNGSNPSTTSGKSKEKTDANSTYASPRPQKPIRPLVARQPSLHQIRVNSLDVNSSDAANRRAFASDLFSANTADMLISAPSVLPSNGISMRPGEPKFSSSPAAAAVHGQSGTAATAATFSSCLPLPSLCQFLPNNSTLTIRLQAPPLALHHSHALATPACPSGAGAIGGPAQLPGQSSTPYHQPPPPQFFAQPPSNQPQNPTTVQLLPFMAAAAAAAAGSPAGPGGPFSHTVNSPRPPPQQPPSPFHLFNMAAPPHILNASGVLVQPPGCPSSGFHIAPMSSVGPNGARSLFTPVSISAFPSGLTSIPAGPQLLPPGAAAGFGLSSTTRLPGIPPPPPLVPAPELSSQVFSLPTAMTTAAPNDNSNYLHAPNISFSSSQTRSADPLPSAPAVSLGTGVLTLQADMPVVTGSSASDQTTSVSSECENSQVAANLPTVTTSFSSSQLDGACPFAKQPTTSTFSELGISANIQVPSSICSGVASGTDCPGVLVQPPPPLFSARPGFPATTSHPPFQSELGGSIPSNSGQPPPFSSWCPLPVPPPLVGAPIPNSVGPDDSVCFTPCSSLPLDGGLTPSMVMVSRQSEVPLPAAPSQPVSLNQPISSSGVALNRSPVNTATVLPIGRRWRPSMRHNSNPDAPLPMTCASALPETPRTTSTLASQPSTCTTTSQPCVEPLMLSASSKSSMGSHSRPLLSVSDVDCRLPKLPKTAPCSETDSLVAVTTKVTFAVSGQSQSSPKPFRALRMPQLTTEPVPPHSSATLPLSCPSEQSDPSSCPVNAESVSLPQPSGPTAPSISQAPPTSPSVCPPSISPSPENVPVSPPSRPLLTAAPQKATTTTCLQHHPDICQSPSSSSPPPPIPSSCRPAAVVTAVSSATAPATAPMELRGDPASPQPQRRIITHLIDGHVLYESNMPFPVRNAMAVVEAALRQMDIKPVATNRSTSVSAQAKLSSSPPPSGRHTFTGGGDFPSPPARHRPQRSRERTPPSPRPEDAAVPVVSTIEPTNQRKRRSTAPTRLSAAYELPTNRDAGVVDRPSVGVTVSAGELAQRPSDGRVVEGGERRPKRQAETSSAVTKAKSPISLQSLPLSSPLMTTAPPPLSVSVPPTAGGALRSPLPPSSIAEESRTKAPPLLASSVQTAGLKLTIHSVYDSTHAGNKERRSAGAANKSDVPHPLPPGNQECGRLSTRPPCIPGPFAGGGGGTIAPPLRPPAPSAPPPPGRIRNWSVTDVAGFVTSTPGCAPYADAFLNNEIDGEALLLLAENQFIQPPISMKIGPALKLAARLETLRTNSAYS
ncbi:hypothetical protein SprV_0301207500 [Sparganum proliferum]